MHKTDRAKSESTADSSSNLSLFHHHHYESFAHHKNKLIFDHLPPRTSWHSMSNSNYTNISNQKSSICPAYVVFRLDPHFAFVHRLRFPLSSNGRQTVGDGAFFTDMTPSVIAVCQLQGDSSMYYYSTTFSGGPGVSYCPQLLVIATSPCSTLSFSVTVAVLTPPTQNALLTEGRQTG